MAKCFPMRRLMRALCSDEELAAQPVEIGGSGPGSSFPTVDRDCCENTGESHAAYKRIQRFLQQADLAAPSTGSILPPAPSAWRRARGKGWGGAPP